MRSIFRTFLWVLPFATWAVMDGAEPASATHVCYEYFIISDVKTANNAPGAREKARKNWNEKARKRTGVPRINWKGAVDHQWVCKQYGIFGRVWCSGKARPCIA